jgi:hypothetical protein
LRGGAEADGCCRRCVSYVIRLELAQLLFDTLFIEVSANEYADSFRRFRVCQNARSCFGVQPTKLVSCAYDIPRGGSIDAESLRLLVERYIPRSDKRADNLLNRSPATLSLALILFKSRMVLRRAVRLPFSSAIRSRERLLMRHHSPRKAQHYTACTYSSVVKPLHLKTTYKRATVPSCCRSPPKKCASIRCAVRHRNIQTTTVGLSD